MNKPIALGAVFLLCLWPVAGRLGAQSRAGSPEPDPLKTIKPNLLPVQNYAVIDLGIVGSLFDGIGEDGAIALDDQGDAAFGHLSYYNGAIVRTLHDGVVSPSVTTPPGEGDTKWNFTSLLPSGTIVGQYLPGENERGCLYVGGGPSGVEAPVPYLCDNADGAFDFLTDGYDFTYLDAASPDGGSVSFSFSYDGITKPGGGICRTPELPFDDNFFAEAQAITSHGVTYVFAADTPAFLTDSATTKYIRENVGFTRLTNQGWGVGYFDSGDYPSFIWDGTQIITGGLGGVARQVNDQGWCLTNGGIWHKGETAAFTSFLAGTPWEHQLQKVLSYFLSNQNAADQRMYVVGTATDDGQPGEWVEWVGAPVSGTTTNDVRAYSWQPYRMKLPTGFDLSMFSPCSVNSSGVIAAFGITVSTGDIHALLLVPVRITLVQDSNNADNRAPNPKPPSVYHNFQTNPADVYRIFSVASDNLDPKAEFHVKADALPISLNDLHLLIQVKLGNTLLPGGGICDAQGNCNLSVAPPVTSWEEGNTYTFMIGIDGNKNGVLDSNEALPTEFTSSIITKDDYSVRSNFLLGATIVLGIQKKPVAANFLKCFVGSSNTIDDQSVADEVDYPVANTQITHIAGSIYIGGTTKIPRYLLPDGSPTSNAIEASAANADRDFGLAKVLDDRWNSQKSAVMAYFAASAHQAEMSHDFIAASSSENILLDFHDRGDLNLAFGYAILTNCSLTFTAVRDPLNPTSFAVEKIALSGLVTDVYDFDFTLGIEQAPSRTGATVQIGYGPAQQRTSGRIFATNTTINATYGLGSPTITQFQAANPIDQGTTTP